LIVASRKIIYRIFIALVIFDTCLSNAVQAADSLSKPPITDVALSDGGILHGQVVDLQYMGQPGVPVVLRSQNRDVAQVTSAADGQFEVRNLHGGVYNISTTQGENTFRLWAPRTAPPVARNRAIVYLQNVRNGGAAGLKAVLGNPIVLPAIIATAIAVPVAISASHKPASP
jgi:hypothetical protein